MTKTIFAVLALAFAPAAHAASLEALWQQGFQLQTRLSVGPARDLLEPPSEQEALAQIRRLTVASQRLFADLQAFLQTLDEAEALMKAEKPDLDKTERLLTFLVDALPKEEEKIKDTSLAIAYLKLDIEAPMSGRVALAAKTLHGRTAFVKQAAKDLKTRTAEARARAELLLPRLNGRILWMTAQSAEEAKNLPYFTGLMVENAGELLKILAPIPPEEGGGSETRQEPGTPAPGPRPFGVIRQEPGTPAPGAPEALIRPAA